MLRRQLISWVKPITCLVQVAQVEGVLFLSIICAKDSAWRVHHCDSAGVLATATCNYYVSVNVIDDLLLDSHTVALAVHVVW